MQGLYCRMDLAQQHGADIAIFLHNLVFWVERNRANGVNFHDGRYWTYNTIEALAQRYPLWSKDQLKRIIAKCRKRGLILVGEYNSDKRDRTRWYSPSDEILVLYGVNLQIAPALPEYIPESNIPPISPWREAGGRRRAGGDRPPGRGPSPPPEPWSGGTVVDDEKVAQW